MKFLIFTQKVDEKDSVLGFFVKWIEEFPKHCDQVTVICLYKGEHHLPSNIRVLSLGKETGASRIKYITRFYTYIWQERHNYDYVWVHMNQIYVILGGLLWRLMGKKVGLWYAHKTVSTSLRIAEKFAHYIFTPGATSFRIPSKKINVMGQGIDVRNFVPAQKTDTDMYHIVSVGRISPVKDYETLIAALEILKNQNINFISTIIGGPSLESDKDYFESIKKLAHEKHLTSQVNFTGPLTNTEIIPYIQKADIFVNSSRTGSLDKTGLEAMAIGVPVATCNEAYKEMIEPYGYFFEKGDSNTLSGILSAYSKVDFNQRQTIGVSMRKIVEEHHSLHKLIERIVKVFLNGTLP